MLLTFPVRLMVSFVNAGGQPLPVAAILKMRAEALAQKPGVSDEVRREAQMAAETAARPMQEVARFQRAVQLPVQPRVGLSLRNVGPLLFEPGTVEYDVETGNYAAIEVIQLCHSSGPCQCQRNVRAYMGDARWQMLDVYALPSESKPVETVPCTMCSGAGTAVCPDAPKSCRCLPDVLRHKCPACKGSGRVEKPHG